MEIAFSWPAIQPTVLMLANHSERVGAEAQVSSPGWQHSAYSHTSTVLDGDMASLLRRGHGSIMSGALPGLVLRVPLLAVSELHPL